MDGIYVETTAINSSLYAIVDTGTTFIIGPFASVDALNVALGGTFDAFSTMYIVNCITHSLSSFPNVTFKISGQAFTLTPLQYILILNDENNDYVCYTMFVPLNINDSNVFDLINRQVGLATSVSYNWTQPVDPTLFNTTTTTTESLIATMSITTGISITSVSNVTLQITTVSSMASEMKTFFHDILNVILLILSIFLVKPL